MDQRHRIRSRRGSSRARYLLPTAGAGILVACGGLLMRGGPDQHSVSEVVRTIQDVALAGNVSEVPGGAGTIGPWRIAAEHVDPLSGELSHFRLKSGPMLVSARTALVHVDPIGDSFSFEMVDVVYTRIPMDGDEGPGFVHHLERYTLGPAPYGTDIVSDGVAGAAIVRAN